MAKDSQHALPLSPRSPQNCEPRLPQSPESLALDDVFESYHPTTVTTDISNRIHPASLHLKPVTWKSLAEIPLPDGERFEIVDGLLVWIPMRNGTRKHQRVKAALFHLISLLPRWSSVCGADIEVESISGNTRDANSRNPDIIATPYRPGSPSDCSSSSEQTTEKLVLLTKDKPAYALIEVTGENTRNIDLTEKWVQYCQTGTIFYYIIDLHFREVHNVERVIVGSKARIPGWTRCDNGDPDSASSSASSSATPNTNTHRGFYYKKVYTGNELVNVGVFQDSPLTASQLMSVTVLNQKVDEIIQRNLEGPSFRRTHTPKRRTHTPGRRTHTPRRRTFTPNRKQGAPYQGPGRRNRGVTCIACSLEREIFNVPARYEVWILVIKVVARATPVAPDRKRVL